MITIAEYLHWRNTDFDLLMHDLWRMVVTHSYKPRWEPTPEVERIMRSKPEGGGPLYAGV
jgi:hypothetical protein